MVKVTDWLHVVLSNDVMVAAQVANVLPCDCAFFVKVQPGVGGLLGNDAESKWQSLPPVCIV